MEELAKLEAQRGNPEYLEGGKAELGLNVQRTERGYIYAEHSENGSAERHRRGQGSISSGMKRTDRDMQQENMAKGRRASNEMCTFLILNISSLQLIPVNMIAYRAQYGSANPTAIIVPAIVATLFSSLVAVVYCKMKDCTARHKVYGTDELTVSERKQKIRTNVYLWKESKQADLLPQERRKNRGGKAI